MRFIPLFAALIFAVGVLVAPSRAVAQDARADFLDIELGKSVVIETPANATAIAITDPLVADVVPLNTARKIQVQGKAVGSTDLVIQLGAGSAPIIYEITVHRDLSDMVRRVDALVDGEPPRIYPLLDRIVVQGDVDDLNTLEAIARVASIYDPEFVNLMNVRGDHQVQLEVIFAEVSRTGLRELGINALWGDGNVGVGMQGAGSNRLATGNRPGVEPFLNGGIVTAAGAGFQVLGHVADIDLTAILSVLDEKKLSKVLARPTVVALSGQQAEFLAGGELPIIVPSGNGQLRIEFKDYGVKLVFVPTVLGGKVIDMRVYVEVSEPDFSVSSRITGIEVPGFISRKGKSHLRVESGMTFAMAGLLSENTTSTISHVPGLGRIPVIGSLFRYVRHSREETELMIFVTPRLVRPLGPNEVPAPPGTTENHNPNDIELFLLGLNARAGSRTAEPTGDIGTER